MRLESFCVSGVLSITRVSTSYFTPPAGPVWPRLINIVSEPKRALLFSALSAAEVLSPFIPTTPVSYIPNDTRLLSQTTPVSYPDDARLLS